MRKQLRHTTATLSLFLVSLGLMGTTPKKSEAAAQGAVVMVCAAGAGIVVAGGVGYCIWTVTKGHCKTGPGCAAKASGACVTPGAACGTPSTVFGACSCKGGGRFFTCYC